MRIGSWFVAMIRGHLQSAVPLERTATSDLHTALILVDLEETPEPKPSALQKMFGLTGAEADLAIRIARGETPADIAKLQDVSISTVRSQLASLFTKTNTKRQAELVSLLARVAILP